MLNQAGFVIYTSDGTGSASCGIIDAEAAAEYRGIFRMVMRSVDGAQGLGFHQLNVLSVPSKTSFEVSFDISSWTHKNQAQTISFAEIGVMGAQATPANIADATKEPGDGNPFIELRLINGKAVPRIRFAGSGSITTGTPITLPARSSTVTAQCVLTIVYTYDPRGNGSATTSFRLNGAEIGASISGVVTGGFQVFGRVCHTAAFDVAPAGGGTGTDTVVTLDLDSVQLINPRYRA
jgi:hypothetical protein